MSSSRPRYNSNRTWLIGSSRAPNFDFVLRTPFATARTLPFSAVWNTTIRSDSRNLYVRSTTPVSRYSSLIVGRSLVVEATEAALAAGEVGDRVEEVIGRQFVPGHRMEDEFAVGELPHQRRWQAGRLAEHHDQVGLAVGGGIERLGHGGLVHRFVRMESLHRFGETLTSVAARIDDHLAGTDLALPPLQVDRIDPGFECPQREERGPRLVGDRAEARDAIVPPVVAEIVPVAQRAPDDHDVPQQLTGRITGASG